MFIFNPPGFADDMNPHSRADWHAFMAARTAVERSRLVCELHSNVGHADASEADLAYLDPRHTEIPGGDDVKVSGIPWGGFPRTVLIANNNDRRASWIEAEVVQDDPRFSDTVDADGNFQPYTSRINQDEYLEWHADEDEHGIYRVSLTCEGPEYWKRLGLLDFPTLHAKYEELIGHAIDADELKHPAGAFDADSREDVSGRYNPLNNWNTSLGAIHLTQGNNTLGAEINLAARATIGRVYARGARKGKPITDVFELICCAGYGAPSRDSDPKIGATANHAAAAGNVMTLTNPIGLYISGFDGGITSPLDAQLPAQASEPDDWWTCVRGQTAKASTDGHARMLRVVYQIPDGATVPDGHGGRRPLRLADLKVNNLPATHGAALAELVSMQLFVTSWADTSRRARPTLAGAYTCCQDTRGNLDLCESETDSAYPDIYDPKAPAALCPDDKAQARRDAEVYQRVYTEALAEASKTLRVPEGVGAFGPDTATFTALSTYKAASRK